MVGDSCECSHSACTYSISLQIRRVSPSAIPMWLHTHSIFSHTQHVLKLSMPNIISVPSQPQTFSTEGL